MINVIGLGYIGLPTALMMASHGVEVIGTDYNKQLVDTLNAGKTTFKEKGLDELFRNALEAGIRFTTEYQKTDMYIVSVPTPYDKFSKKVDACYVVEAVKDVMKVCPKGATVVIESTVSPGTIDKFVRPIIEGNGFVIGEDINLVHAPERIIPGNMVYELLHNNRTIGADNKEIGEKVKEYYSSFCQGEIVVTDIRTAEMTKVVENTFRAVNIAFANELSRICRHDNMDVYEIIRICNMHPRVNILQPGPGVGGHCISVDPWFLVGDYPQLAKVIDESMKTNDSQPTFVLNRIYEIMKENGITDNRRVGSTVSPTRRTSMTSVSLLPSRCLRLRNVTLRDLSSVTTRSSRTTGSPRTSTPTSTSSSRTLTWWSFSSSISISLITRSVLRERSFLTAAMCCTTWKRSIIFRVNRQ